MEPNGYFEDYRRAYVSYYDEHKTKYDQYNKEADAAAEAYAAQILDSEPIEKIRKDWFIDYGCMNMWDVETNFKYRVAIKLHCYDAKLHPELHNTHQTDTLRGWHETNCSCGYRFTCDSGD